MAGNTQQKIGKAAQNDVALQKSIDTTASLSPRYTVTFERTDACAAALKSAGHTVRLVSKCIGKTFLIVSRNYPVSRLLERYN